MEIKNNLTIARGECGGDSVERGFQELLIKDTWTKSRGRAEVGEGGGPAGVTWRDEEKRHTTVIE